MGLGLGVLDSYAHVSGAPSLGPPLNHGFLCSLHTAFQHILVPVALYNILHTGHPFQSLPAPRS